MFEKSEKPLRILVKVTKADINNKQKLDTPISIPKLGICEEYETTFPVLLALTKVFRDYHYIDMFKDKCSVSSIGEAGLYSVAYNLPRSVKRAYNRWVKGKKIKPFNFYLVEDDYFVENW